MGWASWRNGSAFDSRSKGYPFKSGRGQIKFFFSFALHKKVFFSLFCLHELPSSSMYNLATTLSFSSSSSSSCVTV
ncbi:hypothetical protein QBC46DRAFT_372009 [Diplogelasinospora grovesii]|uniref:Uncharacterized protein n=1 Tax=Diplogelasinospora grovesii TaxID=303347 RepID=A0AAN6S9V0_9PEZI|nr:hypothetical protein QBC46DRAFT_372009 [Diplogelasinospora grovesii]